MHSPSSCQGSYLAAAQPAQVTRRQASPKPLCHLSERTMIGEPCSCSAPDCLTPSGSAWHSSSSESRMTYTTMQRYCNFATAGNHLLDSGLTKVRYPIDGHHVQLQRVHSCDEVVHSLRDYHHRVGLHAASGHTARQHASPSSQRTPHTTRTEIVKLCHSPAPVLHSGGHPRVDEALCSHGALHVVPRHEPLHIWYMRVTRSIDTSTASYPPGRMLQRGSKTKAAVVQQATL